MIIVSYPLLDIKDYPKQVEAFPPGTICKVVSYLEFNKDGEYTCVMHEGSHWYFDEEHLVPLKMKS